MRIDITFDREIEYKQEVISACVPIKKNEDWLPALLAKHQDFVEEWILLFETSPPPKQIEDLKKKSSKALSVLVADPAKPIEAAFELAQEQWILMLDPDESIAATDQEKLRGELQTLPNLVDTLYLPTRHYVDSVQTSGFRSCKGDYPTEEKNFPGYFVREKIRFLRKCKQVAAALDKLSSLHMSRLSPPVHHYGYLEQELQKNNKAKALLGSALKKLQEEPFDPDHWYQLGLEWMRQKHWLKAESALERAYRLKKSPEIASQLGASLIQQDRGEEAYNKMREAMKQNPQHHDLSLNTAIALLQLNQDSEALQILETGVRTFPESFSLQRQYGFCLMKLNQALPAREALMESLRIFPDYAEAKIDLALLNWHEGNLREAKDLLKSVLKDSPDHPRAAALWSQLEVQNPDD